LKKNKEVKDYIETYGQPTVEIVSGLFVEGFAGALIPGVTSFISAARGRRLEKNMEIFMNQISNDIYELKTLFNELDSKGKENFKNYFSEIILDYISEERDEEKIEFITNGFKKLLDKEFDIKSTSLYFDILKELRYIDIIVLKEYDYRSEEYWSNENSFDDFLKNLNLDMDRYRFIKEKLLRNGLLESSYDKEYKKFLESYLKLVESLKNPKKQLDRKVLRPSFKSRETLKLSKLGRAFIDFFANEEGISDI
jgi:hypothetical protein